MDKFMVLASRVGRSSDLVLAAMVVAVVVMMIVQVPPVLLDFLIALNLALSLTLLLMALYVSSASRLASLPSLLLLATLFRLGLNVTTTRLILLDGEAGRVVEAFGKVVVAGNVLVGGIIFLVLTLVQFIVIAKGSERVAEVAARFTLDALPGKQMSIDADMRAGSLSLEEAQERRRALERESQLYGALDGAMKFVKGDAIAGLVIVVINILGGLAIGTLQKGMALSSALAHYTILTVGDGLAAQIPALLVSTTAGLIVTRVPGDDDESNLGSDISTQIGAQPRALALAAGLLGALALVPGLPALPFVLLGAGTGVASLVSSRQREGGTGKSHGAKARAGGDSLVLKNLSSVGAHFGSGLAPLLGTGSDVFVSEAVAALRTRLFDEFGLRFPDVVWIESDRVGSRELRIVVNGAESTRAVLPDAGWWIVATPSELTTLGIESERTILQGGTPPRVWTTKAHADRVREAGYSTGSSLEFVIAELERAIVACGSEFLGVQEARDLVDGLEATHPALVAEVLPRLLSLSQLTEVLRGLVRERVSIRDLRQVFDAIAQSGQQERDPGMLVDRIRAHMRRNISAALTGGTGNLFAYVVSSEVENAVRDALRFSHPGEVPGIHPDMTHQVIAGVAELERAERDRSLPRPVVLASADVRRAVRSLLENDYPELPVVALQDLAPNVVIQTLGRVG